MELKVDREFKATPEELYNLWTNPEQISEWFCTKVTIDPKVGGKLEFDFQEECGVTTGEYKELNPYNKIVFTWCNHNPQKEHIMGETLVTVNIKKIDDSRSKMTLIHSGFEHQVHVDDHLEGWGEYYDIWEKKLGETK